MWKWKYIRWNVWSRKTNYNKYNTNTIITRNNYLGNTRFFYNITFYYFTFYTPISIFIVFIVILFYWILSYQLKCWSFLSLSYQLKFEPFSQLSVNFDTSRSQLFKTLVISQLTVKILAICQLSVKLHQDTLIFITWQTTLRHLQGSIMES